MTKRALLPPSLQVLKRKLGSELKPARVKFDKVSGLKRYRITIVSQRFARKPHLKRQDLVWKIIDDTVPRAELGWISLVFPFTPGELRREPAGR